MLYADNDQRSEFATAVEHAAHIWDDPIVTEVVPLATFYPAEPEHQNYFARNPAAGYCSVVIAPKISKVRASYSDYFIDD
jgi:peptide-methionine (S)-S-oxide reductase